MEKTQLAARVTQETYDALKAVSEENGITVSKVTNNVLTEHFERAEAMKKHSEEDFVGIAINTAMKNAVEIVAQASQAVHGKLGVDATDPNHGSLVCALLGQTRANLGFCESTQ